MIATLIRIGWLNLKRDRIAQALTFVLPVIFFSIFAVIFGGQRDSTRRIRVGLVDEDNSEFSKKLVDAFRAEGGLRIQTTRTIGGEEIPLDRVTAEALIREGTLPVAVVLPKGLGQTRRFWTEAGTAAPKVALLADVADPIAPQLVRGLLQKVSFTAAPEVMAVEGIGMLEKYGGPLTPQQQESMQGWLAQMKSGGVTSGAGAASASFGLDIELVNVMQPDAVAAPTISFYAAGIGVMFLLFSCAGAGGTLLEELESGTLDRLIGSRAGMGGVLLGKWIFLWMMGALQLCVMFAWGALVFGLPLLRHVPGFLIMTIVTAAAAAAFGLLLATLSRSRAQLSGMSTIVILTMSAVGGSMFPRFLMSETMQRFGLVTFNAWALDGYLKVFWQQTPLLSLWPQVSVLAGLALVFLVSSRLIARRWEMA